MSDVLFKRGTYQQYVSCYKDENCLYFLDNGQVYRGSQLVTNIYLVSDLPSTQDAFRNSLYIDKDGKSAFFDGEKFYPITRDFVTEIYDDTTFFDNRGATVGAIKKYVRSKEQIKIFPTLYDFPLIGQVGYIYMDQSKNKLYTYSIESSSYIPIRADGSALDIDLIDVNFD